MTLRAARNGDNVDVHYRYGPVALTVTEHRSHVLQFWQELGSLLIEDTEDRAKAGYERYRVHAGGRSVHGEPLPSWDELGDEIRGHWVEAFTE